MIGITGQIGAGKSFLGQILRDRGFTVMDADLAVHQLYKDCDELRRKIAQTFGEAALTEEGVDRKFFADLIFRDDKAREKLESLVYPELVRFTLQESPAFVEAALLENVPEIVKLLDEIWVVTALPEVRFKRLAENRGMATEDARRRMELQQAKSREECWRNLFPGKVLRFLDNSYDRDFLLRQVPEV